MIQERVLIDCSIKETRQFLKNLIVQINGEIINEDSRRIVWTYKYGLDTYKWGFDTIKCETQFKALKNETIITSTSDHDDLRESQLKEPITKLHDALGTKFDIKEVPKTPLLKKTKTKHNQTSQKSIIWKLIVLIGFVGLIFYMGSDKNQTSEIESIFNDKKVFTYSSASYDIEKNGQMVTKTELTYHTFDFNNKIVTQNSIVNGKQIKITYPFSRMYEEKGLLATTYVLTVNTKGLKEIWWSPDVPNLGYDYDDGTRIACYDLKIKVE